MSASIPLSLASTPTSGIVRLLVRSQTDRGGGVEEHAWDAALNVVVSGDVAVDVLGVVARVREEVLAVAEGLRRAGVDHFKGGHGGGVELVQVVGYAGVGWVVPHVVGQAVLQPRPAPHVTLHVPVCVSRTPLLYPHDIRP